VLLEKFELASATLSKESQLVQSVWQTCSSSCSDPKDIGFDIHISITSTIPTAAGMGSSAAYSVALSASLMACFFHVLGNNFNV